MPKKQATLFSQKPRSILAELEFKGALELAGQVKLAVEEYCEKIEVAGSIRRQKPKVHDIDFVVISKSDAEWKKINHKLRHLKAQPVCNGDSVITAYLPVKDGLFRVDFYRARPETFGIHLLIRTGSADHNIYLAGYATQRGMRLKYSQGLIKEGQPIAGRTEQEVFKSLELPYVEPIKREIVDKKPAWMKNNQQKDR